MIKGLRMISLLLIGSGAIGGAAADETPQVIYARATSLYAEADRLEAEAAELRSAIDAMAAQFDDYRERYRLHARIAAVGESLGRLECTNGRSYDDAVIRRITKVGVEIRHAGGSARIPHDCLPVSFRDRFQWSEAEASEVLAVERQEDLVRAQMAALAKERRAVQQDALDAKVASIDTRLATLSTQLARVAQNTSRLEASGRLGDRRRVGSSTIYYRPSYRSSRYRNTGYYAGSYCYPTSGVATRSAVSPTVTSRSNYSSSWCPSSTPRRVTISRSTTAPVRTSSPYLPQR